MQQSDIVEINKETFHLTYYLKDGLLDINYWPKGSKGKDSKGKDWSNFVNIRIRHHKILDKDQILPDITEDEIENVLKDIRSYSLPKYIKKALEIHP